MWIRAFLLAVLAASSATANPWLSDQGGTLLNFSEDFNSSGAPDETTIYVESGSATDRLSIGISSTIDDADDEWDAYAFIRRPLTSPDATGRVSLSAGIGAQQLAGRETEALVIIGGEWGSEVNGALEGWLSIEGEARYATTSRETALQGGATVGVQALERIAVVNELSLSGISGTSDRNETRLTSSIVGSISENARVQLGATMDLSGNTSTGFRLGTWLEF